MASPASSPPESPEPQSFQSSPSPIESDPTPPSGPKSVPESDLKQDGGEAGEEEEEEEEEGECGFCLFMKGGGCKDAFVAWENCVESAEKSGEDIVEKCFEVTAQLKKCMDAHADYYEPVLRAEQAMSDSLAEESMAEKSKPTSEESVGKEPSTEEKEKVEKKEEKSTD